jgi:hypothetical protein
VFKFDYRRLSVLMGIASSGELSGSSQVLSARGAETRSSLLRSHSFWRGAAADGAVGDGEADREQHRPAMRVEKNPWLGVAQATLKTIAPKAQATTTPANISFTFIRLMVILLSRVCAARKLAAVGSALFAKGAAGCGRPNAGRRLTSRAIRSSTATTQNGSLYSQPVVELQCDVLIKTAQEKLKNAPQPEMGATAEKPMPVSETIRRNADRVRCYVVNEVIIPRGAYSPLLDYSFFVCFRRLDLLP